MNLQNLQYLVSVAETGSVTRSAELLRMTQPALSRGLAALEEELGARLFDRLPRTMKLTVFGEAMVRRAQTIFRQIEDAKHEIRHLQQHETTEVIIGSGPIWLTQLLPEAIDRTVRQMPAISVSVTGGFERQLAELVRRGQADFILTELTDDPEFADLASEPLARADYAVIARRGHPLAGAHDIDLRDLLRFQWVMPSHAVNAQKRLDGLFQIDGLTPPVAHIRSTSMGFITRFLEETDSLTFAVRSVLPNSPGLAPLALGRAMPSRQTGVQRRPDGWLSEAAERVLAELRVLARATDQL